MALFSPKKKTEKKAKVAKDSSKASTPSLTDLSKILVSPRITEKAMKASEKNVYAFEVARTATKYEVRDAVKQFFGVTPVKVNIVNKTPRQFKSPATRRLKTERGIRKAYVYLKKGDTISLV